MSSKPATTAGERWWAECLVRHAQHFPPPLADTTPGPWDVYADWLYDQGDYRASALARRIAAGLLERGSEGLFLCGTVYRISDPTYIPAHGALVVFTRGEFHFAAPVRHLRWLTPQGCRQSWLAGNRAGRTPSLYDSASRAFELGERFLLIEHRLGRAPADFPNLLQQTLSLNYGDRMSARLCWSFFARMAGVSVSPLRA